MWKIKGKVSAGKKYDNAIVPDHPCADSHGYVAYHRIVAENMIGRLLKSDEIVHHRNDDGKDNRPENLQVMTNSEHVRRHVTQRGRKTVILRCPHCKKVFKRHHNKSHLVNNRGTYTACSRKCSGLFSKEYKKDKNSEYVRQALGANYLGIYRHYKHLEGELNQEAV